MKPLEIFCDATCEGWQSTQGKAKGKIIAFIPKRNKLIEKEFEIKNTTLRQFINRFELEAIRMGDKLSKSKNKVIYSDSQIAVGWAKKEGINCVWLPREENKAGQILEYGNQTNKDKVAIK